MVKSATDDGREPSSAAGCLLFAEGAPLAFFVYQLIDVPTQACLGLVHLGPELLGLEHEIRVFLQTDMSIMLGP
jgi:hypothetical protein